jgi:prefoldin subunit 5
MASVTLIHPEASCQILALTVITKCGLFQNDPLLLNSPYRVHSSVPLDIFRQFLSELEGNEIEVTDVNFTGLQQLSEEFNFLTLAAKLSVFRPSIGLKGMENQKVRQRITELEEHFQRCDSEIASLQTEFERFNTDFLRLVGEVSALRSSAAEITTLSTEVSNLKAQIPSGIGDPVAQRLSAEINELRREISTLKRQIVTIPSPQSGTTNQSPQSGTTIPSVSRFDSRIISDFPEIFAEFQGKRISLLWRGSRDGFRASEFHRRCDNHSNTLTVILDTNGNIFGGFTPVKWVSRVWNRKGGKDGNCLKADDSLRSFLFTLKNPHNVPAKKFALKAETKHTAIGCNSERGPLFWDLTVSDNCNVNTESSASGFGYVYSDDVRSSGRTFTGHTFFTWTLEFTVQEIEVFEIFD